MGVGGCGVVFCGMVVWYGMVWCGVVWCGMVWYGVVWCGLVWFSVVWCGMENRGLPESAPHESSRTSVWGELTGIAVRVWLDGWFVVWCGILWFGAMV